MSEFEEDDIEVDASTIFKQPANDLTAIKNLDSTLNKFGYKKDDRIDRREMVAMYRTVEKEMEKSISHLALERNDYDSAKEMRTRLQSLRSEFDGLQTSGSKLQREDQSTLFEQASKGIKSKLRHQHEYEKNEVDEYCNQVRMDMKRTQEIQRDNLELQIRRIPRPAMKYSRRLIELFQAEAGLIKLNQYDDARKVRSMIDHILPNQEKKFYADFDAKIDAKRLKLENTQKEDFARLEEKLKGIQWSDIRRRDREDAITTQRLINNGHDMHHAHILEEKLKPEMSIKPSLLWQKRQGYSSTGASLRGQQLLDHVHGKKKGQEVFADSLVKQHDFHNLQLNTVILR